MPDGRNSSSDYNFARTSSTERPQETYSEQLLTARSCHPKKGLVVVGVKPYPREQPPSLIPLAPALRSSPCVIKAAATKQQSVGAVRPALHLQGGGDDSDWRAQARGVAPTVWPDQLDRRQSLPKQYLVS